jgi:hypothetical protein
MRPRLFFAIAALAAASGCASKVPTWSVTELKAPVGMLFDGNGGRDSICVQGHGPITIEQLRIVHVENINLRNGAHNTALLTLQGIASADDDHVMMVIGDPGLDEVILDPTVAWSVSQILFSGPGAMPLRRFTASTPGMPVSVDIAADLHVHLPSSPVVAAATATDDAMLDSSTAVGKAVDWEPVILESLPIKSRIDAIDLRNGVANFFLATPHSFLAARSNVLGIAADGDDVVILDPRASWRSEVDQSGARRFSLQRGRLDTFVLVVPPGVPVVSFRPPEVRNAERVRPPFPGLRAQRGSAATESKMIVSYGGVFALAPNQVRGVEIFDLTNDAANVFVLSERDIAQIDGRTLTILGDAAIDAVRFADPGRWESLEDEPAASGLPAFKRYRLRAADASAVARVQADITQPQPDPAAAPIRIEYSYVDCKGKPIVLEAAAPEPSRKGAD